MSASRDRRHAAVLAAVEGLPVRGADLSKCVILAGEHQAPIYATWSNVAPTLARVGKALHPDTVREVDAIMARGLVPLLSLLDGEVAVEALRLAPLSRGGVA